MSAAGQGNAYKVLVFSGTTDGNQLASKLAQAGGFEVMMQCATELGPKMVPEAACITAAFGRLSIEDMGALMTSGGFDCVVDATHPFATVVTQNIAQAAQASGIELLRLVREDEPEGSWIGAQDVNEAARMLADMPGNILLTTGSKDLPTYVAAIPDFAERLYARILPVEDSIAQTHRLGIPAGNVIAIKGPVSQRLNEALIEDLDIDVLVTKASGANGGFWEKVNAAQSCGIKLMVIHRPSKEQGYSVDEAFELLLARQGAKG